MAVGIDNAMERFGCFILARMFPFFIPGETAVVPPDAEFPDDEPGLVLEMFNDAGNRLAGAVHALGVQLFGLAGVIITAVFVPRLEIRIRFASKIAAGRRDRN